MSADNDLIRRGDVLDAMCKGPRTVQERIDAIRVIIAQPDPRDEVIARLVDALTVAANRLDRCAVDYETGSYEFIETCEWVDEARAALAAAKAVQP